MAASRRRFLKTVTVATHSSYGWTSAGGSQLAKDEGQDSIEHLWQVLKEIAREMIAKAGGIEKVGAHRITDAAIRRLFAVGSGSGESDRLGRAFVKAAVQCVCAEAELRQRFKEHPQEKFYYERYWDAL